MTMELPPLPGTYKNRRTGLRVFGIFTIIFGGFCVLLVLFMALMLVIMPHLPKSTAASPTWSVGMAIYTSAFYGVLAAILITLGIGSFRGRRWARALLAVGAWIMLVGGVAGGVMLLVTMPQVIESTEKMMAQSGTKVPHSMLVVMQVIQGLIMAVFYVVLPLVWALFYSSRDTKLTCEALDPVRRWTDRCPMPVLALVILLFIGGVSPVMAFFFGGVLPFFGLLLTGWVGLATWCVMGALCLFLGWSAYRLKPYTWWVVLGLYALAGLSSFMTFSQHSASEMFTLMGYPPELLEQMRLMDGMMGIMMTWGVLAWMVPAMGFVLWTRRYFVAAEKGNELAE